MPTGWTVYVAACAVGVIGGALAVVATDGPSTLALVAALVAVALLTAIRWREGVSAGSAWPRETTGSRLRTSLMTTEVAAPAPVEGAGCPGLRRTKSWPLPSPLLLNPLLLLNPPLLPQRSSRLRGPAAGDRRAGRALPEPAVAPAITDSRPLEEDDWHGLARICGAISSAQLGWMRADRFSRPWHDEHVRPFVDLEPLVGALRERPFSVELRTRLGTFAGALTAFAAFYGENTFPDPLLSGTDWRFFDWSELIDAAPGASTDDLWSARAAQMQGLALAMAECIRSRQGHRDDRSQGPRPRAGASTTGRL